MKTNIILFCIVAFGIILTNSTTGISQNLIGVNITNDCTTQCASPITFCVTVTLYDSDGDPCKLTKCESYIPSTTYYLPSFDNCPGNFDGPEGSVYIEAWTLDTYDNKCCCGDYLGHWSNWGDIFNVTLENCEP